MRTFATPEESASSILAVFKARRARANEVLMLGTVDRIFLSRSHARTVDFTLGLRHAVDMGWVELTGQGRQLRLTQSGFEAMSEQEPAHRATARR
jgi:hypothetical protein